MRVLVEKLNLCWEHIFDRKPQDCFQSWGFLFYQSNDRGDAKHSYGTGVGSGEAMDVGIGVGAGCAIGVGRRITSSVSALYVSGKKRRQFGFAIMLKKDRCASRRCVGIV